MPQLVWIIETREDGPGCASWDIDSVWATYDGGNARLMEMVQEYPELDLRMRAWDLQ